MGSIPHQKCNVYVFVIGPSGASSEVTLRMPDEANIRAVRLRCASLGNEEPDQVTLEPPPMQQGHGDPFLLQTSDVTSDDDNTSTLENDDLVTRPQLPSKLLHFFRTYNISENAMQYLLNTLNEEGITVPGTVYMLKKSEVKTDVPRSILPGGGEVAYLTILENIRHCVESNSISLPDDHVSLNLTINIDGLPLFRSSPVCLWPILFTIKDVFNTPLAAGIYVGEHKPTFDGFVSRLFEELKQLQNYVHVSGNLHVKVSHVLFVCDAPARAFLQCVKAHSGYNACTFCRVPGVYLNHKVVFPYDGTIFDEREDDCYEAFSENNQISRSPLADITSLKTGFPPEYMHSTLLGVMRRLLQSYLTTNHGLFPCRMSESCRGELNERAELFKGVLPKEFNRRIRPFSMHSHFKATEYRSILLYTGPVLFKGVLSQKYYHHFLLLHFSIYVFISPDHKRYHGNAKACIEHFLLQLEDLFNVDAYTFNAHCLLHLFHFVRLYGPLDNFSSFRFENFLRLLKRRIKSGRSVMTQAINAIVTLRNMMPVNISREFFFSCRSERDRCALVESDNQNLPLFIEHVDYEQKCVSGRLMKFSENLYNYPYPSSVLGIGVFSVSEKRICNVKPKSKCILFPHGSSFVVIPFACAENVI